MSMPVSLLLMKVLLISHGTRCDRYLPVLIVGENYRSAARDAIAATVMFSLATREVSARAVATFEVIEGPRHCRAPYHLGALKAFTAAQRTTTDNGVTIDSVMTGKDMVVLLLFPP
jgi:hypothetical protein